MLSVSLQVGRGLSCLGFEILGCKKCNKMKTVVGGKYLYGNSRFFKGWKRGEETLSASFCCLFSWIGNYRTDFSGRTKQNLNEEIVGETQNMINRWMF